MGSKCKQTEPHKTEEYLIAVPVHFISSTTSNYTSLHALQNGVFHNVRLLDILQYTQESLHVINVFNLVAKEGLLSSNEGRKGHRIYLWHGSRDSVVPGINAINSYNFLHQLLPPSASIYLDNKVPTVFENYPKMSHLIFSTLVYSANFSPIKSNLSGNTV